MFGGFKASLNLFGGKKNKRGLHSELTPDMSVNGAYRTSRDDSFGYRRSLDQPKKTTATEQVSQQIRPTKSVNDLSKAKNVTPNLRHSTGEVSRDPRGAEQLDPRTRAQNLKAVKIQEKEQKKLDKQRLAEHKAREKQAAQEYAKQEKLRKEREKREAQQAKVRKPNKKPAPQPQAVTPAAQTPAQYPSNTLESSISRSSGPPPYSNTPAPGPEQSTKVQSKADGSGNVVFTKPVDTGSWDMISQHREQTIRPTTKIGGGGKPNKQMVMDLNYNVGATSQAKDNSDA